MRPNIVFICSDQQHWQALGCMDRFFQTPAMDQIAERGALFTQAYSTCPQCSPSRASIYTGLWPHAAGVVANLDALGLEGAPQSALDARHITWMQRLHRAGYCVGYIGKWHLGNTSQHGDGLDTAAFDTHNLYAPKVTDMALAFLNRAASTRQPFALCINYDEPHTVYDFDPQAVDEQAVHTPLPRSFHKETFHGKPQVQRQFMLEDQGSIMTESDAVWRRYRSWYRRCVHTLDEQIGRVWTALHQQGLLETTVVVITSDHGDMDTHHRLIFKGPFLYEQMVRVPLIIHGPSRMGWVRGRQTGPLLSLIDLAATVCEWAGVRYPDRSRSSWQAALNGRQSGQTDAVFAEYHGKQSWLNPARMIRTTRCKYVLYRRHEPELYDLEIDPDELINRANDPDYRDVRETLHARLTEWMRRTGDSFNRLSATDRAGNPLS